MGLACNRLKKFRKEIVEATLLNPGIRANLLERGIEKMTFDSVIRIELLEDTKNVALDCVRAYLKDAISMMGLPLLEVTAKAVLSERLVLKEWSSKHSIRTGKKEKFSKDVSISIVEKNVDELDPHMMVEDPLPNARTTTAEAKRGAMEDLIYKGSVLQIKKYAFDFLSLEEDLIDDDDDSWELMGRDLWLKSTFLYGDLNHVISNSRDEHKKTLTNLGNKLFHFMEEEYFLRNLKFGE
ncbi:putative Photosynthetic NDH subunit of lumenal location 3, chloroplastic [Cocos nucifera]|nr:putative Photosynthetic NDH subunit of lumenal location 3, chloroplastic [Cocos nucifera]